MKPFPMNLLLLSAAGAFFLSAIAVLILFRPRRRRSPAPPPDKSYRRGLSPSEKTAIDQMLYDRACTYMVEQRPFLVESYTLDDLALALNTNKMYLSQAINRYSGKNFRQYLNYYRIMYALDLFRANPQLRVAELAHLSGFCSPTSFFQNFKSVMGEAPFYWCQRNRPRFIRKPLR